MWTLRLRGPKGKAATMQIRPEAPLRELCDLAAAQLAIKGGKQLHLTFRSGFPPRVVEYTPDDTVQLKFANNDSIVVDTASPDAEPRQAVATAASSTLPKGRAATRGVAASVARATANARAAAKAKATPKEPVRGGVHTLHSGSAKPRAVPASQKRKERGDGVRLGASMDEESVVVDPAPRTDDGDESAPKYRRTRALHLTSKDDIGIQLAEAVSGQSKGRVGQFFRAATKSAVEHQYAMTLANARLKAALSQQFEIQSIATAAEEGSEVSGGELRVKFKESVRKWKEEVVTLLQPMELQAALKYILISGGDTGREMLKPFNMAQVSPRVFWNIARLYNGDVEAGLAALVPDEDWSYLDTRSRQMSKKAMEAKANEEVYKQWKKGTTAVEQDVDVASRRGTANAEHDVIEIDSDGDNEEKDAATSEQQLQLAMAYAEQAEKRSLREAMARAATARVEARARAQEVTVAIREQNAKAPVGSHAPRDPNETESEGEEKEEDDVEKTTTVYCDACNKARILTLAEAAAAGVNEDATEWTCARLAAVDSRVASCDAIDDEVEQIAGATLARLLQKVAIYTRSDLANASIMAALRGLAHPLDPNYAETKAKLQELMDEARLDEVNDAMDEIVGSSDLVGALELQKLGTPADLAETPADLVVTAMAASSKKTHTVDLELVLQWQQHAREKITKSPWMGEWRTI